MVRRATPGTPTPFHVYQSFVALEPRAPALSSDIEGGSLRSVFPLQQNLSASGARAKSRSTEFLRRLRETRLAEVLRTQGLHIAKEPQDPRDGEVVDGKSARPRKPVP